MKENGEEATVMRERVVAAEAATDAIWNDFDQHADGLNRTRGQDTC